MNATIDKFGRVVIPKRLRQRQGMEAGAVVKIEEDGTGIRLTPVCEDSGWVYQDGILVYRGRILRDTSHIVQEMREDRMRKVAGLQRK